MHDDDRDVGELIAAIDDHRRALDADPDNAERHAALASTLYALAYHPASWGDDVVRDLGPTLIVAAIHMSRACGARPDDPDLRESLSAMLHDLGAYDLQAAEVSRALRARPDDPQLLLGLADALDHSDETRPRALEALLRAGELAPDDPMVLAAIAGRGPHLGVPDEAVAAGRRLLAIADDDDARADALAMIGDAHAAAGRAEEAVDAFTEAGSLQPGEGHDHRCGEILAEAGRLEDAVAAFLREAEADPEDGFSRREAAVLLVRLGRLDEAERWFASADEADPELAVGPERGAALLDSGRVGEAIAALRSALSRSPTDVDTRRLLADALERDGRHGDAAYESAQADAMELFHQLG
jgi:tetratricopeptide (TPR) repeat protein